jgi:hypothetical protein
MSQKNPAEKVRDVCLTMLRKHHGNHHQAAAALVDLMGDDPLFLEAVLASYPGRTLH